MTKPEAVKAAAEQRLGCPYVYGGTGKICTPSYRSARAAQYPQYATQIENNCPRLSGSTNSCASCKWADPETGTGKPCFDCAQFALTCMAAANIPLVSGANSQWLKTRFSESGDISGLPKYEVALVFRRDEDMKMHHVGIYMGDGTVIHARGHKFGVVRDNLTDVKFTHYGVPAGLYDDELPTLRKGNRGEYVTMLQNALNNAGFKLEVDGKFGSATEHGVQSFQLKNNLKQDGICGPKTWTALAPYLVLVKPEPVNPSAPELDEDDDDDHGPANIVVLTYEQATDIRNMLRRIITILENAMQ